MSRHTTPPPRFSFVYKRLTFESNGSINDSKNCSIQQEEIDARIQKELSRLNPAIQEDRTRIAWWTAIGHWLQVDPDKRSDLSECHLIKE